MSQRNQVCIIRSDGWLQTRYLKTAILIFWVPLQYNNLGDDEQVAMHYVEEQAHKLIPGIREVSEQPQPLPEQPDVVQKKSFSQVWIAAQLESPR